MLASPITRTMHQRVKIIIVGAIGLALMMFAGSLLGPRPATAQSQPPPTDPCAEYDLLEIGQGSAERQHWFNHLDAAGYARFRMACKYQWGTAEWECLNRLITQESGWNHTVYGPQTRWGRAYGIPQALPGHRMASHGHDWQTNPRVQVRWMLDYIHGKYTTPSGTGCWPPY